MYYLKGMKIDPISVSVALPKEPKYISRRDVLRGAAAGATGMAFLAATPIPVQAAIAEIREKLLPSLKARFGDRPINDGRVVLEIPDRADTGLSVPTTISVPNSPMTEADHVKSLHVFTELNPRLEVGDYYLTPRSGLATVSTRIRLAQSQNVFAFAVMSDNTIWGTSNAITVTLGACAAEIFLPDYNKALRRRLQERGSG